jgi:uncharacterized protein (DUF362 family)
MAPNLVVRILPRLKLEKQTRRDFLKAAAVATTLSGCAPSQAPNLELDLPKISATQAARKRQGISRVLIAKSEDYNDHLFDLLKPHISELGLPSLKGKTCVVKTNMVEIQAGHPITTNPSVVKAAHDLAVYLGASDVAVVEGPGHMRDMEYLLRESGIGALCKRLGVRFVDLNVDDAEEVQNIEGFSKFKSIWLPKSVLTAGAIISVPKMKTHHWVGITASMKNLFGCIPGKKYGWPKNTIHMNGIKGTAIDLVHLLKPMLALVDGIVAMEGDGPINGTAKNTGVMVLGEDFAAVDSTCARIMNVPISDLPYIQLAGEVIGNVDERNISIIGAPIDSVKQVFELPITLKDKALLAQSTKSGS